MNAPAAVVESDAEIKARWARIDAMYADGQMSEKGPKTKERAEALSNFFAAARARREAAENVGWHM